MCGICGIFRPDGAPVDAARVSRMSRAMTHRGPDAEGLAEGSGYALGHRRLAIIDLSQAGNQPMSNEDGTLEVVFNGEIYNFRELHDLLRSLGHRFRSHTDTEVLVHGYEEWGIGGLLKRIRGMYAFALLDAAQGEVHLVRDPLGKKPLFFRWQGGELAFASSARALAFGLETTPEANPAAIDDLLWNLYIPGPQTIFQGVEKLLPGRAVSLGRDGRRRDLTHWEPDFCHPESGRDDEEWLERMEVALTAAVQRRLVADVPVGVLLSGGIDSSLVTALAARTGRSIKTFSVQTEDPALDESEYAAAVARRYATDHHVLAVRSDILQGLPDLVAAMGEPLADASAANLFAIARLARESVTVVLTGDGGDECFGGYAHFRAYNVAGQLERLLPSIGRSHLAALGQAMRCHPGAIRRLGTLLLMTAAPASQSFGIVTGYLDTRLRGALFTREFTRLLDDHQPTDHCTQAFQGIHASTLVDRAMHAQLQTILPDDYLTKVDVATMAASLEARCPFLDLECVDLAMQIPVAARFRGYQAKSLLRRLARRLVPHEVVDRRKQGFVAPVAAWLRRAEWQEVVDDLILGPHVEQRGWFRRQALEQLVTEHRQGVSHAYLLWALLVLELWLRGVEQCPRDPGTPGRHSPVLASAAAP